jgi:trimethylamine:corrinoid methyltransferase-like protein
MIYGMGMLDMGMTLSLPQFLIDNEIAKMILRTVSGIKINTEHLAIDTIKNVGIGGHYMAEDNTLKHFRTEAVEPELFARDNYDGWLSRGKPEIKELAIEQVKKIIDTHEVEPLPDGMEKEFNKIIASMGD